MYIAKRNFHSLMQGAKEKGDPVEYNATWADEGLIEIKPEPSAEIETKPDPKAKKKQNKAKK
jgi:hypothetical protein